ncbi:urea transporter [Collimonas sp. NPDC087041]|uniref:urea transporter n=1 Tax=Collimonas sp. NPDC087041 TaxID=3363960 RepID=UPI00380AFC74
MDAVRAMFLGISQSMFQQNGYTGLIFLLGVFLSSPWVGLTALLGVLASTATGWAIGAERSLVLGGVYGFNGFFAGVALGSIFSPTAELWMVVVVAGALSALLMHALHRLLGRFHLPALSAPFVCVLWLVLLAVVHVGRLAYAQGAVSGVSGHLLSDAALAWTARFTNRQDIAGLLLNGTLRGVSQIFYQDDVLAGLIFLLGLSVSSMRAAAVAAIASFTGALTALLIGAPDLAILHGIYGFNSVLSALAVITLSQKPGWQAIGIALLCAAFAAIATSVMIPLSQSAGLPALSAPFCVAAWMFLLALQKRRASQAG